MEIIWRRKNLSESRITYLKTKAHKLFNIYWVNLEVQWIIPSINLIQMTKLQDWDKLIRDVEWMWQALSGMITQKRLLS